MRINIIAGITTVVIMGLISLLLWSILTYPETTLAVIGIVAGIMCAICILTMVAVGIYDGIRSILED